MPVFAEVDPAVLSGILSKLAGEDVDLSKTGTGTSNTGFTNITSSEANSFLIFSNTTAKVWESMDVIVKAVTKSGTIASWYKWTIYISVDGDYKAKVPYIDWYTFTSTDQGAKTFSKGLSFSKAGTFIVHVSDLDKTSLSWSTSVIVTEKDVVIPVVVEKAIAQTGSSSSVITEKPVTENKIVESPSFKIIKVETGDRKATFTFKVSNDSPLIKKFQIIYANPEWKSNKVTTYEKERIKNKDGNYVWYVPNLELTKYVVSIAWIGSDGETIAWVTSKPFEADLSLLSAGKCIIPNVAWLRVLSKKDTSVLYWDSIPEAIKYKIYKKNASGEYMFVHETKKDSYTIHVSDGSVKYDEFSVKAVCSDGTESVDFSPSTSVRTGPAGLILLGLISLVISLVIMHKRRERFWKL